MRRQDARHDAKGDSMSTRKAVKRQKLLIADRPPGRPFKHAVGLVAVQRLDRHDRHLGNRRNPRTGGKQEPALQAGKHLRKSLLTQGVIVIHDKQDRFGQSGEGTQLSLVAIPLTKGGETVLDLLLIADGTDKRGKAASALGHIPDMHDLRAT